MPASLCLVGAAVSPVCSVFFFRMPQTTGEKMSPGILEQRPAGEEMTPSEVGAEPQVSFFLPLFLSLEVSTMTSQFPGTKEHMIMLIYMELLMRSRLHISASICD